MELLRPLLVVCICWLNFSNGFYWLGIPVFYTSGTQSIPLAQGTSGIEDVLANATSQQSLDADMLNLKERPSILELAYENKIREPAQKPASTKIPLCGTDSVANLQLRQAVKSSITRTLKFIGSHKHLLESDVEPALPLAWIQAVDARRGGELQQSFPLKDWISEICNGAQRFEVTNFCTALTKNWESQPGSWYETSVIEGYSADLKSIGNDKEVIWSALNVECLNALATRCEVPRACQQTFFDPAPESQYMLTHQLFLRVFAEQAECSLEKDLVDRQVNHRLCAKIYKEAELIQDLDVPERLRDLFAEQIGFCGYAGYPNFLRKDWLDSILSWQSKSEYGCFVGGKDLGVKYVSTDKSIKRLATPREQREGVESNEQCLPHLTSVSLMALSTYWDYLEDKCV